MLITKESIMEKCENEIMRLWETQKKSFPDFLNDRWFVSKQQKKENEKECDSFLSKLKKNFTKNPVGEKEEMKWVQDVEKAIQDFIATEKIMGIRAHMSQETFQAFEKETKKFIYTALRFDEKITIAQVWQALRNYFIYAMIVELQNEKQNAKDAIIAYSLLYPYTDNYIDSKLHSTEEKKQYDSMIEEILQEKKANPKTRHEQKTAQLLEMLLKDYKGLQKNQIATTLLALLEGQHNSILQQEEEKLSELDNLKITMYKGSTSVLADYLLATDQYSEEEVNFYLKFGFLLQLVDDIQDLKEDEKDKNNTILVVAKKKDELEKKINQLLWFIFKVMKDFCPPNPSLLPFVYQHCIGVTLLATAQNAEFIPEDYFNKIEPYLPFSYTYIQKMQKFSLKGMTKTNDGSNNIIKNKLELLTRNN